MSDRQVRFFLLNFPSFVSPRLSRFIALTASECIRVESSTQLFSLLFSRGRVRISWSIWLSESEHFWSSKMFLSLITQPTHDVRTTLYGPCCNVLTSYQCPYNVVLMSCAGWKCEASYGCFGVAFMQP